MLSFVGILIIYLLILKYKILPCNRFFKFIYYRFSNFYFKLYIVYILHQ